jgi:hypothetical protein
MVRFLKTPFLSFWGELFCLLLVGVDRVEMLDVQDGYAELRHH